MVGSTYALLGLGFSLIFGVLGRINLAYGSTILVGVFAGSTALRFFPGHPILALVATLATTVIVGIYVERLCFRAIPQKAALASMVSSFAIWMQLDEFVIQSPWSQMYAYSFPAPFEFGVLGLGSFSARVDHIFMLGAALVVMMLLWWIVSRTSLGRSMRAVSNDVDAARILGLNVHSIGFRAFLLASAPESKLALNLNYARDKFDVGLAFTRFSSIELLDFQMYEATADYGSFANKLSAATDSYNPKLITDLVLGYQICEDVKLQIGANNLFNEYPDQQDDWVEGGGYWDAVQMGFGGAYYYAQMAFSF